LTERVKILSVYGISLLYVAVNMYMILHDKSWGLFLPVALFFIGLYLFSLDKVILIITFLTPLAVNLKDEEFGLGISLPTEPLLFGVLLLFVIKMFMSNHYDQKIVRHPVSIAIFLNLIWIFITCFTSELPVVSIKFLVARLWFIVPMYFIGIMLFKNVKNTRKFVWLYLIPLVIVIFYTLFNHAQWGFNKPTSNMVMKPFYNDHTAYGAVIALFLPVIFTFAWSKLYKRRYRIASLIILSILTIGIIFSYSRAAWLSVALMLVTLVIIYFRIKFKWIFLAFGIMVGLFFLFRYQFIDRLEKNKQDSSTDFVEHIQSISNISSDASNLERINRWQSAIKMFEERPIFGWGPGTYQFVYAPFQRSKDRTIISTNYGDMGNAHSEYIGPLSESGVLGMLTFIGIVIAVIYTGLRVYRRARDKEVKVLSLGILLGLITYYIHGLLNNFLDTDKASVPFWAFTAILVAFDIYYVNSGKKNDDGEEQKELTADQAS
jgi:O-antigen ligase